MAFFDCRLLASGGAFRVRRCESRVRLVGEPLRASHDDIVLLIGAAGSVVDIWAGDVAPDDS